MFKFFTHQQGIGSNSQNPNPNPQPEDMQFGPQKRTAISDHSYLDLSLCFAPQINSSALALAKILSKIKNLKATKKLKETSIENKNWPPHILNSIKSLNDNVKDEMASELVQEDISDIDQKITFLGNETGSVKKNLWTILKESYDFLCDDENHFANQKANIQQAFNKRLLHHMTTFIANIKQQEEARKKKEASKPQNMTIDPNPNRPDVVDKNIDAMIQKAVKAALNQRQTNKPNKPNRPNSKKVTFEDKSEKTTNKKSTRIPPKQNPNQQKGKDKKGGKGKSKKDF